eukprot:SAG31_NODE_3507_length_4183_cov_2.185113_2_plen_235_part_00
MVEIARKDRLAANLGMMLKVFPRQYSFFPLTFRLPADAQELRQYVRQKRRSKMTFIVKPHSGCQGKGIFLTQRPETLNMSENVVVQTYIKSPLLIDGLKFDLRVYALVTDCDPLRIFIFREGLGRFATAAYVKPTDENIENTFMHLTNYSLNKHSEDFVPNTDADKADDGSKRSIESVLRWLDEHGHDSAQVWGDIGVLIGKTVLAIQPTLAHNRRTCFGKNGERWQAASPAHA